MTRQWLSKQNKFRLIAVLLFIPLMCAVVFTATLKAPPLVVKGDPYPMWAVVLVAGAAFIFLVFIVPTLGNAGRFLIEFMRARRGVGGPPGR